MKLAIIAVTKRGAMLGKRLSDGLGEETTLYVKSGRQPEGVAGKEFESLINLITEIFASYEGIVFIMATGIVVRVIAPHLRSKKSDPAVVVMDDQGQHAISLLSGHIGGANELADRVGTAVGARPVITTATDGAHQPAADVLAVKLGLTIEPFASLKLVNAALANQDRVAFYLDTSLDEQYYQQQAAVMNIVFGDWQELADSQAYDAAVIITDQELSVNKPHVFLRPPTLAVGIGCRKDTPSEVIKAALREACRKIKRSVSSIAVIASSVVKQEEVGLLTVIDQLAVPSHFYSNEQLLQSIEKHQLTRSKFVEQQIGVGNVCEAAVLLAGQTDKLLLNKTKFPQVTVAIAAVKSR